MSFLSEEEARIFYEENSGNLLNSLINDRFIAARIYQICSQISGKGEVEAEAEELEKLLRVFEIATTVAERLDEIGEGELGRSEEYRGYAGDWLAEDLYNLFEEREADRWEVNDINQVLEHPQALEYWERELSIVFPEQELSVNPPEQEAGPDYETQARKVYEDYKQAVLKSILSDPGVSAIVFKLCNAVQGRGKEIEQARIAEIVMAITSQEIDGSFADSFFWDSDYSSEAAGWLAEDLYRGYEQQQVIRWGGDCLDDVLENIDVVRVLQEESRQRLKTEQISKCDQDALLVVSAMLLDSTEVTGNRYRFSKSLSENL